MNHCMPISFKLSTWSHGSRAAPFCKAASQRLLFLVYTLRAGLAWSARSNTAHLHCARETRRVQNAIDYRHGGCVERRAISAPFLSGGDGGRKYALQHHLRDVSEGPGHCCVLLKPYLNLGTQGAGRRICTHHHAVSP